MGQWKYRKTEPADVRGLCVLCNIGPQKRKPNGTFYSLCSACNKKLYTKAKFKPKRIVLHTYKYRDHKKTYCEHCGFIALHRCQLDVDHIDGNHKNNSLDNLQTLCANCHRLKTHLNRDIINAKPPNS